MAPSPVNLYAISWLARKPSKREEAEKSGNFLLQNANWHLKFSYDHNHSYYGCLYQLTLLQGTRKENLKKSFRVIVFCCAANCDISEVTGYCKLVRTTNEVICSFSQDMIVRTCGNSNEINITCIFHDFTLASSLKNERTSLGPDLESLTLDFGNLLKDQTFSDVKLRYGEQTVPAHKTVLSARSEVFAAMFRNKMAENKTGIVELKDLDAKVIQLFLRYVYTGQVSNVPDDMVPALYAAGDKYAVHALKKSCSDRMVSCLTKENCVGVLALADAHADADFKAQVMSFICRHEEILVGNTWLKFSRENASLAVEVYENFAKGKIRA